MKTLKFTASVVLLICKYIAEREKPDVIVNFYFLSLRYKLLLNYPRIGQNRPNASQSATKSA